MSGLSSVPFLVIDVETTGFSTETHRIIEIAAALVVGHEPPRLVFDTVIDPGQPVDGEARHGITAADVAGAPRFAALRGPLRALLANRVLVAHHAAFDRRHLEAEWGAHGQHLHAPWLCTMRLPRLTGAGPDRLPLWWACQRRGIAHPEDGPHSAAADALATAHLLRAELHALAGRGVDTLDALAGLFESHGGHAEAEQLRRRPLPAPPSLLGDLDGQLRPRRRPPARPLSPARRYLHATVEVLSDLRVDDDELERLDALRRALGIAEPEARRVYRAVWDGALRRYGEDGVIDAIERRHLTALATGLGRLGWVPPAIEPPPVDYALPSN